MTYKELATAVRSIEPVLPQVALTPEVIRNAWMAAGEKLTEETVIRVICDDETIRWLQWQAKAAGQSDHEYLKGLCFSSWGIIGPPRFDVVDGKRIDYWRHVIRDRHLAWVTAPAQIHLLMDGERAVCGLATRRVMQPENSYCCTDGIKKLVP